MAKRIKEEIKSGIVYETTKAVAKSLEETLAGLIKTGGEHLGKKIVSFFDPKPRALFDFLVDNLYPLKDLEGKEISKEETDKAEDGIKKYLIEAKEKNIENEVVSALIKVLTLDPTDKHGNFPKGHNNARIRIYQLGIMEPDNFWQSIETMIDDPGREKIMKAKKKAKDIKKKVALKLKKIRKKTVKAGKEAKGAIKDGINQAIKDTNKKREEIDNNPGTKNALSWSENFLQKSINFKDNS